MLSDSLASDFLRYLAQNDSQPQNGGEDSGHLPAMDTISRELGVSVSKLREQMEAARTLGLIEVRPRTGIRRLPYQFAPAVRQSVLYAIALDPKHFDAYANLRDQIEAAYWRQATEALLPEDLETLKNLVNAAWEQLRGTPPRIPHREHRDLHLTIYQRIGNPFVYGLLEAFWDAYEAFGLNLYTDYNYLQQVWTYHQQMVDALCAGDFDGGYRALIDHKDLLHHRTTSVA
ncbi:MAG: FadR/GntR family transcriptional regulator [Anaerolineales bacterium]